MYNILLKDYVINENFKCYDCRWYEFGDEFIGLSRGCSHDILYNEDGSIDRNINDLILACMTYPEKCVLWGKKNKITHS